MSEEKFKVTGKISDIVVNSGTTKDNEQWKAAEFTVTELAEEYPNAVRLKQFGAGERVKYVDGFVENNKDGDVVTVEYDSRVRRYDNPKSGKTSFFQENNVWRVNKAEQQAATTPEQAFAGDGDDILPF